MAQKTRKRRSLKIDFASHYDNNEKHWGNFKNRRVQSVRTFLPLERSATSNYTHLIPIHILDHPSMRIRFLLFMFSHDSAFSILSCSSHDTSEL